MQEFARQWSKFFPSGGIPNEKCGNLLKARDFPHFKSFGNMLVLFLSQEKPQLELAC